MLQTMYESLKYSCLNINPENVFFYTYTRQNYAYFFSKFIYLICNKIKINKFHLLCREI